MLVCMMVTIVGCVVIAIVYAVWFQTHHLIAMQKTVDIADAIEQFVMQKQQIIYVAILIMAEKLGDYRLKAKL